MSRTQYSLPKELHVRRQGLGSIGVDDLRALLSCPFIGTVIGRDGVKAFKLGPTYRIWWSWIEDYVDCVDCVVCVVCVVRDDLCVGYLARFTGSCARKALWCWMEYVAVVVLYTCSLLLLPTRPS